MDVPKKDKSQLYCKGLYEHKLLMTFITPTLDKKGLQNIAGTTIYIY